MNSLSFCLSVKFFTSPSYLNEMLAGHSNLGCRFFFFFFHHFKYVLPFPSGLGRLLLNDKTSGFLASGGDEFNLEPEMRLDCSELLCNKSKV